MREHCLLPRIRRRYVWFDFELRNIGLREVWWHAFSAQLRPAWRSPSLAQAKPSRNGRCLREAAPATSSHGESPPVQRVSLGAGTRLFDRLQRHLRITTTTNDSVLGQTACGDVIRGGGIPGAAMSRSSHWPVIEVEISFPVSDLPSPDPSYRSSTVRRKSRVRGSRGAPNICSGLASSTIRPWSMNTTRDATCRAKLISCVTTSIVIP